MFLFINWLEVGEYAAELRIILWGVDPEIWARGNLCHHESDQEGSSRSEWILGLTASRCWNALHGMTWLSWVLTNRNAYILCKGEELCSNPTNWQWRTCVSIGSHCLEGRASLVQVVSRGLFVSTLQVNGRVWRLRKIRYNKLLPA
jgi:hypothetical protein